MALVNFPVMAGEEAELLMFHHLHIASMLFEATGKKLIERVPEQFHTPAFKAFVEASEALYPED